MINTDDDDIGEECGIDELLICDRLKVGIFPESVSQVER